MVPPVPMTPMFPVWVTCAARRAPGPDGEPALYRPADRSKDQTYFLFDLPRERLSALAFPLGDLQKGEVRELARELKLETADKPESQGICFVPDGDVRAALDRLGSRQPRRPGPILDESGNLLGQHHGALGYTRGQRKGLGLSGGPWYVTQVRPDRNEVVVTGARDVLWHRRVAIRGVHWYDGAAPAGEVRVQVRHRQASVPGRAVPSGGTDSVSLVLEEPVWSAAPGQAAVVYDAEDERVLGGGWITEAG